MLNISWDAVDWPMLALLFPLLLAIIAVLIAILSDEKSDRAKRKKQLLVFSLVLFLSITFFAALLLIPARGPWEVKDQGVFERVEYTDTRVKKVPIGYRTIHKTIIHFADGHTAVIPGEYSVEFPRGTVIKIMTKNNFYRIEKSENR